MELKRLDDVVIEINGVPHAIPNENGWLRRDACLTVSAALKGLSSQYWEADDTTVTIRHNNNESITARIDERAWELYAVDGNGVEYVYTDCECDRDEYVLVPVEAKVITLEAAISAIVKALPEACIKNWTFFLRRTDSTDEIVIYNENRPA